MERTPDNFSIEDLVTRSTALRPADRMFRVYAHSPNLFELLLVLEDALSGGDDFDHNVPDDLTWSRLLKNIQLLGPSGIDPERRRRASFYVGQIALLLDAIEARDAHANKPGLVRFYA